MMSVCVSLSVCVRSMCLWCCVCVCVCLRPQVYVGELDGGAVRWRGGAGQADTDPDLCQCQGAQRVLAVTGEAYRLLRENPATKKKVKRVYAHTHSLPLFLHLRAGTQEEARREEG